MKQEQSSLNKVEIFCYDNTICPVVSKKLADQKQKMLKLIDKAIKYDDELHIWGEPLKELIKFLKEFEEL